VTNDHYELNIDNT